MINMFRNTAVHGNKDFTYKEKDIGDNSIGYYLGKRLNCFFTGIKTDKAICKVRSQP